MNIAYVCADRGVPVFGHKGCSIHVQEVLRALRRQGHQVTLFAARLGARPRWIWPIFPSTNYPRYPSKIKPCGNSESWPPTWIYALP